MAFKALDTTQNTAPRIACLTQSGITAVGRYYTRKRNSWKIVKLPEVQALSAAGIQLWPVYQNTHRDRSHFSAAIGRLEANDALDYALNIIGQPRNSGIYFAADYDASEFDLNTAIIPHFEAINAAFAAAGSPYRVGVYGSGLTCTTLLSRGLVQLTWLSQSNGFRGTAAFKASRRWNLLQLMPQRQFCNFDDEIDPDTINDEIGDFGAFTLQGAAQPPFAAAPPPADIPVPVVGGAAVDPAPAGAPAFHGVLTRGMVGSPDVRALQVRLNELKFGPLVTDGDFGERTGEAVMHFQARNSSADGRPLAIDGEVGPTTWAALFGPTAVSGLQAYDPNAPLRELVIDIAASQIGVVEQPVGSNRGPEVDAYIRATGLDPTADSYPWCVCFLYWTFGQAAKIKGIDNPLPKTAGVISLWNLGRNMAGEVVRASEASGQTVKRGMIFHLDTGGGKGHAGLVVEVSGDQIVTIEGNTNQGGSREGFGVFRRSSRPISTSVLLGYLDFCE